MFIRHLDYPDSLLSSSVLVCMRRGRDCSYLLGVVIAEQHICLLEKLELIYDTKA